MEKRRLYTAVVSPVVGAVGSVTAAWMSGDISGCLRSPLFYIAAVLCAACMYGFLRMRNARARVYGCVFAFFLTLSQLVGTRLERFGSSGGLSVWLGMLIASFILTPAAAFPAAWLLDRLAKRHKAHNDAAVSKLDTRYFLICLGVIGLCYEIVHMAYLPGLIEYDSGYQLYQSWNHVYSASNPLMHTFILGRFYLISEALTGNVNPGIYLFCLCQVVLVAGTVSYGLTTLRAQGCPRWLNIPLLIFFALNPALQILSISCTKDVPFYALTVLQLLMVYNAFREPERFDRRGFRIRLAVVTVFACLMRANMITAMFLLFPIVLLGFRGRRARRVMSVFLLVCVLCAYGVNSFLIAFNNADGTELRESFNVPIAQLARVIGKDADAGAAAEADGVGKAQVSYIPYVIDLAKWDFDITSENVGTFMKLWAEYGRKYPGEYLDAFLLLSRGYWDIGDSSHARVYGEGAEWHFGVLPSRVETGIGSIHRACLIPGLYDLYERLFSGNEYLNCPVLRVILSPAAYCWLMLFCVTAALFMKRWELRGLLRMPLFLLIGVMMGPCCILRYALIFILFAPLSLGLLFCSPLRAVMDEAVTLPSAREVMNRARKWFAKGETAETLTLPAPNGLYRFLQYGVAAVSGAFLLWIVIRYCFGYIEIFMDSETTIQRASWPAFAGAAVFVILCVPVDRLLRRVSARALFAVLSCVFIVFGIILVRENGAFLRIDMLSCLWAARDMGHKEYSYFWVGQYMNSNQHQMGLMTLERIVIRLCHDDINASGTFCAYLNILLILLTDFLFWRIAALLAPKREQLHKWIILASVGFVPHFFMIMMVYGHVPGLLLLTLAVYAVARILRADEKKDIPGMILFCGVIVVSVLLACWMRGNCLIGAIALGITALLILIRKRVYAPLIAVLLSVLLLVPVKSATSRYYSDLIGRQLDGGMPSVMWVAMGLQEGDGWRDYGWFNNYNYRVYVDECGSDREASSAVAKEEIKTRLTAFVRDPAYAARFFTRKLASTWCDSSFQTIWAGNIYEEGEREGIQSGIFKELYKDSPTYSVYCALMSGPVLVIYLCAFAGLLLSLRRRRSLSPFLMLTYIYFIGGFLFHMVWETKAVYVYSYFVVLIPAAVCGAAQVAALIRARTRPSMRSTAQRTE